MPMVTIEKYVYMFMFGKYSINPYIGSYIK